MSVFKERMGGHAYGLATSAADYDAGLCVVLSGDNAVTRNTSATAVTFGILGRDAESGRLCVVWTNGGIYDTDQFTGATIAANDLLANDAATGKLKKWTSGESIVGQCISNVSGVLRFKLLV